MRQDNYQLIYVSMASFRFTRQNLMDLLVQSRKFNQEKKITGLLLYVEGHFMQLLEGSRKAINELMVRIAKDRRHQQVKVLEEGLVAGRQFDDWSMAFLDFESPQVRNLPGYSTFLEDPVPLKIFDSSSVDRTDMLDYFKAIMLASNAALLRLADQLEQPTPKTKQKR